MATGRHRRRRRRAESGQHGSSCSSRLRLLVLLALAMIQGDIANVMGWIRVSIDVNAPESTAATPLVGRADARYC